MKKVLTLISLLVLAVGGVVAQPRIHWLENVHNYGAFDENDGKVTCTMRFVNTGNSPLSILAARATCGCTTPSFTKKPVAPGDTGMVQITYNPIGRPGRFSKKIFIDTNGLPSRSTLEIKGVVVGASNTVRSRFPVDAGPLKLRTAVASFGQVVKGHGKSSFIDVYNTTADSVKPEWRNVPPYIHISAGTQGIAPGDYGSFTFYLESDKCPLYGVVTDEMTLVPDVSHPSDTVNVSTVAIINEDFSTLTDKQMEDAPLISVTPSSIDFDVVRLADGKVTKTAIIENRGKSTLIVRRVYSTDRGIKADVSDTKIKKGKKATVTVTVDLSEIAGDVINGRVSIITNSPEKPVASLRVVGMIK